MAMDLLADRRSTQAGECLCPSVGKPVSGAGLKGILLALSGFLLNSGCTPTPQASTDDVIEQISASSGYAFVLKGDKDGSLWPEGVDANDGLVEQECIRLALHNNASFQSELAKLGLFAGEVARAGEIANPSYSVLFPVGRADFESTWGLPIEFLWLRRIRVEIAQKGLDAEAESLLQTAHNLAREIRVSRLQVRYARKRLELAHQEAEAREKLLHLAREALAAGGTTGLAVEETAVDATLALSRVLHREQEVNRAELQLWALLGVEELPLDTLLVFTDSNSPSLPTIDHLKEAAILSRPDLRAASIRVEQAAQTCKLTRNEWIKLSGLLDVDLPDGKARISPGLKFDIPIFNQGQADQAVATAALDLAARRYMERRWQILVEVTQSYARYQQGLSAVTQLQETALPTIQTQIESRSLAEQAGLGLASETVTAQMHLLDALTALNEETHRLALASVELDRAVGCRCDGLQLAGPRLPAPRSEDLVTRKDDS